MQNTERQKFEENWKSAFDGAEMTPSDSVWNSIELDLAGQESAAMKKRVVFYQRLAAATVLFALLTGTYAFYTNYNRGVEKNVVVENKATPEVKGKDADEPKVVEKSKTPYQKENIKPQVAIVEEQPSVPVSNNEIVVEPIIEQQPTTTTPITTVDLPKEEPKKEVTSPIIQTAPTVASLEPQDEREKAEQKKNRGENTWLAVGAAAGNYSPNAGSSGSPMSSADIQSFSPTYSGVNAASNADNKTRIGTSYSVGMAVGKKFGRFVVQTGVNLNKQQVDYTSSFDTQSQAANTTKASLNDYALAETATLRSTAAYTVNSSMEIVSIPVQAGYMIIDRKLGWQFNAGVSPDFFLKNTLVDKSGQRERFTQGAGDASPYRSVNWSGLVNTELSYKIGEHYRLSVVPGIRYSFNSLLKDPGDSGKPLILDVGFRFKYLFD